MLLSNLDANTERLMSCNEFCGTRLFSASLLILTPCAVYKPIASTRTFLIEFSCLSTV